MLLWPALAGLMLMFACKLPGKVGEIISKSTSLTSSPQAGAQVTGSATVYPPVGGTSVNGTAYPGAVATTAPVVEEPTTYPGAYMPTAPGQPTTYPGVGQGAMDTTTPGLYPEALLTSPSPTTVITGSTATVGASPSPTITVGGSPESSSNLGTPSVTPTPTPGNASPTATLLSGLSPTPSQTQSGEYPGFSTPLPTTTESGLYPGSTTEFPTGAGVTPGLSPTAGFSLTETPSSLFATPTSLPTITPTIFETPTASPTITLTPTPTRFLTPTPTLTRTPTLTSTPLPLPPWVSTQLRASDPHAVQLVSGRVQLIMFFAYWNGPCQAMAPVVQGVEREYNTRMNFIYLDIDDPATEVFQRQLGFDAEPQFFLLDQLGIVLQEWQGYVTVDEFRAAFEAALSP
jgi:thiol-disulfide isomerase/thioredoxin